MQHIRANEIHRSSWIFMMTYNLAQSKIRLSYRRPYKCTRKFRLKWTTGHDISSYAHTTYLDRPSLQRSSSQLKVRMNTKTPSTIATSDRCEQYTFWRTNAFLESCEHTKTNFRGAHWFNYISISSLVPITCPESGLETELES